jgi:outer membrane receptor protein involved in Fe transport
LETELNFSIERLSGFVNYSFAARLGETILDNTIQASNNQVTWTPAHIANVGLTYRAENFTAALTGHFQGDVQRRQSDLATAEFTRLRPNTLPAWFTADLRVGYMLTDALELGLLGNNLLDTKGMLMKNFDYPFDYQIPTRRILASLRLTLR